MKLTTVETTVKYQDNDELRDADHFKWRSLLMCMLWLCRTRQDLLQDIVQLQTEMVQPKGRHVKILNALLRRAKANVELNGLHFRDVGPQRRLVQITNSGHITKLSSYP